MACRLLHDSIASYRSHGINEWIGPFYPAGVSGAPGYVASAAGSYFASKTLRCDEAAVKSDDGQLRTLARTVARTPPNTSLDALPVG